MGRKAIALLLVLLFFLFLPPAPLSTLATDRQTADRATDRTAEYMLQTVKNPQVGSIGGEWAVIGLARGGYQGSDLYYESYYQRVEKYVSDRNGVLHEKKYTEYSRLILALTAAGYDPRNVAGYDLILPLGDFEKTIWQGISGAIFALISLDSANYPIPENREAKTQATRALYIAEILRCQHSDGGFHLTAGEYEKADPDLTGMALQALAKYQHMPEVKAATEKALEYLSAMQNDEGGYAGWGAANPESAAQVLVALCELGISAEDPRFVKNGKTLIDNLLSFSNKDGSFRHTDGGSDGNPMSTEQAFYGLVAAKRLREGRNSLYRMEDAEKRAGLGATGAADQQGKPGLPFKNPDVKGSLIVSAGKTFDDIQGHKNQTAIEALAAHGIVGGKSDTEFDPNATMTRAEFAAIITRGLGLVQGKAVQLTDVPEGAWYAGHVGAAYAYGIVNGTSGTTFHPEGTITREATAVMVARGAKLCGMDTALADGAIRDMLAPFCDYTTVSDWALASLAFCYGNGILSQDEADIRPAEAIKRCEAAEMLYYMLKAANLL